MCTADGQNRDRKVIIEGETIPQLDFKMELHSVNSDFLQLSKTFCC